MVTYKLILNTYLYLFSRQFLVRPTSFLKPVKKEVGRFMTARCG